MVWMFPVWPCLKLPIILQCGSETGRDIMMLGHVSRAAAAAAAVLLLWVQSLHGSALPAVSSYEFTAYRMQQFNLVRQKHGEFRSLGPKAWLKVRGKNTLDVMKATLRNTALVHTIF